MRPSRRAIVLVTGGWAAVTAALLGGLAVEWAGWLAGAWVALAFATLANVLFVAVRASPLFRAYGDAELNTWVAYWPFVLLPTVLVVTALVGQLVVVRALRRSV